MLAVSLGGRLACVSAARHLGLWMPEMPNSVHLSRPMHAGRTHGDPTGTVVHWQSAAWTRLESPVEPLADAVRQILLCCGLENALTIIDSALNKGFLTMAALERIVASLPPRFRSVLREVDPASESGLETLCRYRLSALGVRIRSQVEFDDVGRIDLLIGDRLIIEADGRQWHEGPSAFLADRSRDLALMQRGYLVIRLAYVHIVDEWELVELTVRAIVERREHLWSAAHRRAGLAQP